MDRAETVTRDKTVTVTEAVTKRCVSFEATVSTDDTIMFSMLSTVSGSSVFKQSDGSSVTHTKSTNVLTITQAGLTNVPVTGFVIGS